MPRLILKCDTCDSRWDGDMYSEYPNLRICAQCNHTAAIRLMDLMGWDFVKDTLQSKTQHFISMLTHDGHFPTRTGSTWVGITGAWCHASSINDSPPNPPLPAASDASRYVRFEGNTGNYSPEGRRAQSDSLFEESPIEAKIGDAEE